MNDYEIDKVIQTLKQKRENALKNYGGALNTKIELELVQNSLNSVLLILQEIAARLPKSQSTKGNIYDW